MAQGNQAGILPQLQAAVDPAGGRRQDLHDQQRVGNHHGVPRQVGRAAAHHSVRLEIAVAYFNRHAVRPDLTGQVGGPHRAPESVTRRRFHQGVAGTFGRHGHNHAIDALIAATGPPFHPGAEFRAAHAEVGLLQLGAVALYFLNLILKYRYL